MVEPPTIWKMMVTGARLTVIVRHGQGDTLGTSFGARTMMNWPGWAFFATSGASITSLVTVGSTLFVRQF